MRMMGGWMWMMFVFFSFHAILSNLPSYDDCDVNAGVTLQMTLAALGVNVVEKCEQQFFQFLHSHTHTQTLNHSRLSTFDGGEQEKNSPTNRYDKEEAAVKVFVVILWFDSLLFFLYFISFYNFLLILFFFV